MPSWLPSLTVHIQIGRVLSRTVKMRMDSTILGYRASPIPFQNSLKRSAEGTFYYGLLERKPPLT